MFSLLFGSFTQAFGSYVPACSLPPASNTPLPPGLLSDAQFRGQMGGVALQFLYLAAAAAALAALQQGCWMLTSTRQARARCPACQLAASFPPLPPPTPCPAAALSRLTPP
jgi:hypothetical protein